MIEHSYINRIICKLCCCALSSKVIFWISWWFCCSHCISKICVDSFYWWVDLLHLLSIMLHYCWLTRSNFNRTTTSKIITLWIKADWCFRSRFFIVIFKRTIVRFPMGCLWPFLLYIYVFQIYSLHCWLRSGTFGIVHFEAPIIGFKYLT